ncbi:RNA polymerase sigma factor [Spongisporangium articulatum]|uniref:RNA polymerase sigma factor n=1 Tax=Spongisporangium articulatum TaxID=3362603 RepID=A0ABW8AMG9_9ACTN
MSGNVADLVRRAHDGDEAAWGALVDRFAPLLWSVCRRYRLSATDADDVAQAVWLKLLEHLPRLREPAALPGWLATTTSRECLRVTRVSGNRQEQELVEDVVPENRAPAVDAGLLRAERFDALRAAFAALGDRCRALLALLMRDPAPGYEQIGVELGMPVGSIGPTRARCLDSLRRTPELAALLTVDGGRG